KRLTTTLPLAVEQMRTVFVRRLVIADDLDAATAELADAAVGGVDDEEPAGRPLVHVRGRDHQARAAVVVEHVPLVDPAAYPGVECLVLRAAAASRTLRLLNAPVDGHYPRRGRLICHCSLLPLTAAPLFIGTA